MPSLVSLTEKQTPASFGFVKLNGCSSSFTTHNWFEVAIHVVTRDAINF